MPVRARRRKMLFVFTGGRTPGQSHWRNLRRLKTSYIESEYLAVSIPEHDRESRSPGKYKSRRF